MSVAEVLVKDVNTIMLYFRTLEDYKKSKEILNKIIGNDV
jgi:hypothetical protein